MKPQSSNIANSCNSDQTEAPSEFAEALETKQTSYSPALIAKIEKGRKSYAQGEGTIITVEELNARIQESEDDFENGRVISATDLLTKYL